MKKALLVIDMQNVCVGEKHARFFQYNNSDLLHEVNKVIDANENNLVIYIKNVMKKNLINKFAPFHAYEGTEDVDFAKELHIVSDNIFIKYKGNAFTNSGLDILLKKHNIEYVEVVGVDGGACVALTALGAIKNGYIHFCSIVGGGLMFVCAKSIAVVVVCAMLSHIAPIFLKMTFGSKASEIFKFIKLSPFSLNL